MKKKCFLIFLVMMTCMFFGVAYGAENEITRKIVSVVYDDSMSKNKNQRYEYSDYALQMIKSLLGKDDKLTVIKKDDFECINEANEWLNEEAEYNEDTAKYCLIVITDGTFIKQSENIEVFLDKINENFENLDLEFEFVFLDVDEMVNLQIENIVESKSNSKYLKGTNEQEIYDSIFQIAKLLNFSDSSKAALIEKKGEKILEITSPFLFEKMTILIQGAKYDIKKVYNKEGLILQNVVDVNSSSKKLEGRIIRATSNDLNHLKPGKTEIEFETDFNIEDVVVLFETCVKPEITIVDEYDSVLSKDSWMYFTTDELVKIRCELQNEFDNDTINFDIENLKVELLINGQNRYQFKFDKNKNAYYTYVKMEKGINYMYALVEAPDLLVAKSNNMRVEFCDNLPAASNIGTIREEKFAMEVVQSSEKKYKFVDKFKYRDIGQAYPYDYHIIQLLDSPDGIILEIDGKRYKKDQDIRMDFVYGKIHDIDFYCNSDYTDTKQKKMILKMKNNFKESYMWSYDIGPIWKIDVVPKVNPLNKPESIRLNVESVNNTVNIPYSLDTEYKNIYEYKFTIEEGNKTNSSQTFKMEFIDLPNGIVIEYMGNKYVNREKIPLIVEYGKVYELKICVNNRYRELKEKNIKFKLFTDVWGQDIFWNTTNSEEENILLVPEVYPINIVSSQNIDILKIPYSLENEYKHILKYDFVVEEGNEKNISGDFELQLVNVPNGIEFEYEGTRYKNGEKIQLQVDYNKIYTLDIYANSNYKEIEEQNIILRLLTNAFNQQITWNGIDNPDITIKVIPLKYPIKIYDKNDDDEIDTQNEVLELEIVRTDSGDTSNIIENVKLKNIESLEDNSSFFSGFTYKIENNEASNTLKLKFKPNIFAWIRGNELDIEIYVKFNNGVEEALFTKQIILTNLDTMVILKPCIIVITVLFILIGYVFKRKFDDNAQVILTEDGDSIAYGLTPNIITVLLPYISHKTKIGMIKFKAGKNKTLSYSVENLKVLEIDGLSFKEYVKNYSFNDRKVVMRKDKSSVVIKTFDGTQKYEYLNGSSNVSNAEYKYVLEPSVEYSVKNFDDYSDEYLNDEDYLDRGYMEDDQI